MNVLIQNDLWRWFKAFGKVAAWKILLVATLPEVATQYYGVYDRYPITRRAVENRRIR